jgi:uncharacterized repeat protein (TIGR03803 family)
MAYRLLVTAFAAALTWAACVSMVSAAPAPQPGYALGLPHPGEGFASIYSFGAGDDLNAANYLLAANGTFYGTSLTGGTYGDGTVFEVNASGVARVLHTFTGAGDGLRPAGLTAMNGHIYGVTEQGIGKFSLGSVFEIDAATGTLRVIYRFNSVREGSSPSALVGINGVLYVLLDSGGAHGAGAVAAVSVTGVSKTVYSFSNTDLGSVPTGLIAVNGVLYGTTSGGGVNACNGSGCGTVFSLTTAGVEKVLYAFAGPQAGDGSNPAGIVYANGEFYGTTTAGGTVPASTGGRGTGTIFELTAAGKERVIHSFAGGADGAAPVEAPIAVGPVLYGTTPGTSTSEDGVLFGRDFGTVFKVSGGTESVLYQFPGGAHGAKPQTNLVYSGGELYGGTALAGAYGLGGIFAVATSTGAQTVLSAFSDGPDGQLPTMSALFPVGGVLYGTATAGGSFGFGTVFSITTAGAERTLYAFKGGRSGGNPVGLTYAGAFYATLEEGGGGFEEGNGATFEILPSGAGQQVHEFGQSPSDGRAPNGLTPFAGALYGATTFGGAYGYGVAYSLSPDGRETIRYAFKGGTDGAEPSGSFAAMGNTLYGTTQYGGGPFPGNGTIFALSASGAERVVYRFKGGADGSVPSGGLTPLNGLLYGTTQRGGTGCFGSGCGTVFVFDPATRRFAVLYRFPGATNGPNPFPSSLTAVGTTLYGTTEQGGTGCEGLGCGTVFEVTTAGVERVRYAFRGGADGSAPSAPLTFFNGTLYGTTTYGGKYGVGTVFAIAPRACCRVPQ